MTRKPPTPEERSNRVLANFDRLGRSPARWAHHPERVREAVRRARFRPMAKECFSTSQRLVIAGGDGGIGYVEGYVSRHGAPIHHAWNTLDGEPFDLTLEVLAPVLVEIVLDPAAARLAIVSTSLASGYWRALYGQQLAERLFAPALGGLAEKEALTRS